MNQTMNQTMNPVKFRILSDLHLEFYEKTKDLFSNIVLTNQDCESYLILAGDIGYPLTQKNAVNHGSTTNTTRLSGLYIDLLNYFKSKFKGVILVAGNHEYYECRCLGINPNAVDVALYDICQATGVIFLQKDSVQIEPGLWVHGCTLFSDVTFADSQQMNDVSNIASRDTIVNIHKDHMNWLCNTLGISGPVYKNADSKSNKLLSNKLPPLTFNNKFLPSADH